MPYEVELKQVPRRNLAAVKFHATIAELPQQMGTAFGAVIAYLGNIDRKPAGPAVSLYTPTAEDEFDVEAGFVVAAPVMGDGHVVPAELPASEVATTTHVGPYEGLPGAYEAIQAWIRTQGREPGDQMWEEYFSGPEAPPEQIRTGIYWLLKPR